MSVRLSLFGAPAVAAGDGLIALPFERRTQLVVYLAVKRAWVSRAELAARLWPEQETKLAYTNLRKALHRLQSFAWADRIESRGHTLRFAARSDVHEFEQALRERRLADALALYRGPLLAGFDATGNDEWTSWLAFERDRLQSAWRGAAQQYLAGDCDAAEAVDLGARLLSADPFDEDALKSYIDALSRTGQVARARQVYRDFVQRLQADLGVAPSAELKAIHDALGVSAPAGTVAPRLLEDDGFVGRTVELRRAVSLLTQDDCRLLTVTGPGGVGKTRLAQRVVRECASLFEDGATFIALEDLATADELGGRLAGELGIALKGRADAFDQVVDALRAHHALLVLDNFEHLVDAAPRLERLFAACPRVKAVVTSRVRLGLGTEWLLPLTGLPVPEPEDVGEIESFDAVRLFDAAARRVDPGFDATSEPEQMIAICRAVDGLPLALELAAAWTRVLSCRDIAAELQRSGELLQSTDGSRPARHASIQAVFEQSWQLLAESERQALARLSVFRGGFSASAARAVGGVALPVLAALVDKSLLHKEGSRCFLHPLVHQFAHAKLRQLLDAEDGVSAHGQHFLAHLVNASDRISHADPEALREIDTEFENIRAAWQFGVSTRAADSLARAAYGLMCYCDHRGRRLEGFELLQQALSCESVSTDPQALSALAAPAAWLAYRLDRYAEAEALALKAMSSRTTNARRSGGGLLVYRAATVLGATCLRQGRSDEARDWLRQALDVATKEGDPINVASALDNLGLIMRTRGELDDALQLYRQALLKHREVGDAGGAAICLNNQGVVHILRSELTAAQQVLQEARQLCERHGLPSTRCMVEVNLANVALKLDRAEQAAQHARKALEVSAQTGQRGSGVEARYALVRAALAQGDLATARSELSAAMAVAIAIGRQELLVHGIWLFAELLAAQGEQEVAGRALALALQQPALVGSERQQAELQLRSWGEPSAARTDWTGPPVGELVHRIVTESAVAYGPLIAALGAISTLPSSAAA
jgi:predicted ATPase/DNA-binding SARP family transcriptional activator/Flp pilus assembly protein TadD